jgi:aspartate/methionine/tyrosine aminotransferase
MSNYRFNLSRHLLMTPSSWHMPARSFVSRTTTQKGAKHRVFATHSKRGVDAVSLLPTYLADARVVERYSPETPHGALQLGIAENQMLEDLLVPALTKFGSTPFAADCIYYQPTQGRPGLRQAMADYLRRTLKLSKPLKPESLILGAGCNAVLENLCIALADPGQGVLIPTPYYAAFEFDLGARASLHVIPVTTFAGSGVSVPSIDSTDAIPIEAYYPTHASLEAAYQRAIENGEDPRILLISHPNNPLGICYPAYVVEDCIAWCRSRQIHLISDEIYAGSVYGNPSVFTSAIELAGDLGEYVHLIYALSKDFALSGLRVGVCYSENPDIQVPLQKLNDLCQISSQTQTLVENMMKEQNADSGDYWTSTFLQESCARLRARGLALSTVLVECGIPHLPADSGLFCWMDFGDFLPPLDPASVIQNGSEDPQSMQQRERSLYLELMNHYGLLFTPGLSMRNERPGFFRFVFSAASEEEFAMSLIRLRKFATEKKRTI